ncbi:MAG: hypothetical protein ACE365_06585 [Gammaproteobacteria bacterium]
MFFQYLQKWQQPRPCFDFILSESDINTTLFKKHEKKAIKILIPQDWIEKNTLELPADISADDIDVLVNAELQQLFPHFSEGLYFDYKIENSKVDVYAIEKTRLQKIWPMLKKYNIDINSIICEDYPSLDLSPWRKKKQAFQQKRFVIGCVSAIIILLIILSGFLLNYLIAIKKTHSSIKKSRMQFEKIKSEVGILEKHDYQNKILAKNILSIQKNKNDIYRDIQMIKQFSLNKNVILNRIEKEDNKVKIDGISTSSQAINDYINQISNANFTINSINESNDEIYHKQFKASGYVK